MIDSCFCYENYFDRKFYNDGSNILYYTDEELEEAGGEKALAECSENIKSRLRRKKTVEEEQAEKEEFERILKNIKKTKEERKARYGKKKD